MKLFLTCLVYFFAQDTREWTNGVLTVAALEAVDEPVEVNTWIVCDGDIDPEWIESLNSVLVIGYLFFYFFFYFFVGQLHKDVPIEGHPGNLTILMS